MVRLLAVTPALLLAAGLLAAQPAAEPKEFKSTEGRFKAKFPGEVKPTEAKKAGKLTTHTTQSSPKANHLYQVVYFDLDFELPADQAKGVLKLFASGIKGKELSEKNSEFGPRKLPAREAVYEMPGPAHIRQFMVLDGKRLYQVIVGAPTKDEVSSKAADAFLASFEIVK